MGQTLYEIAGVQKGDPRTTITDRIDQKFRPILEEIRNAQEKPLDKKIVSEAIDLLMAQTILGSQGLQRAYDFRSLQGPSGWRLLNTTWAYAGHLKTKSPEEVAQLIRKRLPNPWYDGINYRQRPTTLEEIAHTAQNLRTSIQTKIPQYKIKVRIPNYRRIYSDMKETVNNTVDSYITSPLQKAKDYAKGILSQTSQDLQQLFSEEEMKKGVKSMTRPMREVVHSAGDLVRRIDPKWATVVASGAIAGYLANEYNLDPALIVKNNDPSEYAATLKTIMGVGIGSSIASFVMAAIDQGQQVYARHMRKE